jgi:YD repeat-containing protein
VLRAGTCAAPPTTVAAYAYDAQGPRKSKTIGGTTTIFVTDADNREVLEYDCTSGAFLSKDVESTY